MPRIRYSEEVRQRAVSLVLESRTPATQVAREIGCSPFTLHSWVKRHRQQDGQSTDQQQEQATFVPVNIIDAKSHPVEIITPTGITIRLSDASPRYIAELLHVLASC